MYLGLSNKKKFLLHDIQGNLLIIELSSTYCMTCPKDIPVLNEIYSAIENDPGLKGKVKIASIAVGNTDNEIRNYRKEYKIQYPVIPDPNFKFHKIIGNPRVPYTIFLKRSSKGKKARIFYSHQGNLDSSKRFMEIIKDHIH